MGLSLIASYSAAIQVIMVIMDLMLQKIKFVVISIRSPPRELYPVSLSFSIGTDKEAHVSHDILKI